MASYTRLGSQKIMAFVGVRDPERAKTFYRDTLGLKLVNEQLPFALVFDAHGIMLRVSIVQEVAVAPYTVLGWEVPDIASAVKELLGAGVEFERYEKMKQDKLGIWTSPSGARIAWFKDPDGNLLSLTQF
jgi:catechol 2,3-dioxygenase-like lactoylglutathione lyase family enzyme